MAIIANEVTEPDSEPMITTVSVHSPVIQCTCRGNSHYTSYAISLKSNNPCFTQATSCVRRRYSEFVSLRRLLKMQHPNIEPPPLPPKSYFSRFNPMFIEHRTQGLQEFLESVIDVPVYLSNKGIHLFLQTHKAMSEIEKQVEGDVPAPQLLGSQLSNNSFEYLSATESSDYAEYENHLSELHKQLATISEIDGAPSIGDCEFLKKVPSDSSLKSSVQSVAQIPVLHGCSDFPIMSVNKIKTANSNDSSSESEHFSPSSGESTPDFKHTNFRRVSFSDKVTVAQVNNQLWNIASKQLKAGSC